MAKKILIFLNFISHPINISHDLISFHTLPSYFHYLLYSSTLNIMMNYNWSPELQTLVDLLNTLVSQAPPTPDEFDDASLLHHRSSALPTPRSQALFQPPSTQPLCPPPYQLTIPQILTRARGPLATSAHEIGTAQVRVLIGCVFVEIIIESETCHICRAVLLTI
jgi:hypothetical protein